MPALQDLRVSAPLVIAEGVCFIVVCSFMVFLRYYARRVSGSSVGLDDCFITFALIFVVGLAVTLIAETAKKGFGYPASVGDAGARHPDANVAGWPTELIQIPALGCIKLSFLFLYRRVFTKRAANNFSWANWFMISLVTSWMIAYFFVLLFLCGTNFSAYWTNSTTEKTECLPTDPVHLSYAITDVITDILTILLPIPEVWKLHLPTRRKWAVTGVFGLGAITIAMSIIRMVIYKEALSVQFDPDADFEYITTLTSYFSMLEAGLGICASCLPVQYGLLRSEKVRDLLRTTASLGSRTSSNSHRSHGSHFSHRSWASTQNPFTANHEPYQASETGVPLPTNSAKAGHDPESQDIELGRLEGGNEIIVTQNFETSK